MSATVSPIDSRTHSLEDFRGQMNRDANMGALGGFGRAVALVAGLIGSGFTLFSKSNETPL